MRSHVQPGLVAGADPTRFVSKHWGWLRALLVLCLLFAVGATETEEIRFQSRQSKRPIRVRQGRNIHAGRRAVNQAVIDASSSETWEAASVAIALDSAQVSDSSVRRGRTLDWSLSGRPLTVRLVSLESMELPAPPGSVFPPGIRLNSNRAPPHSLL
jgi:hypothetical protein